jgi:hypothetical protein
MSVGQQHVTWAETNGGVGVGDRHDKRGAVAGGGSVVDNNSSRSRSTEQLDRLLRGLDELSGTLPDLATATATAGGRRSVSREREALRAGPQPPLPRADVLREGGRTPVICAFIICDHGLTSPYFFGPALRAPSPPSPSAFIISPNLRAWPPFPLHLFWPCAARPMSPPPFWCELPNFRDQIAT